MTLKRITITFIALFIPLLLFAQIDKVHENAGITCADCHKTAEPVKKAPSGTCKSCHGIMTDGEKLEFKDDNGRVMHENPHSAHPGSIRCTLCHASHKPSELYCNTGCHHTFDLQVP